MSLIIPHVMLPNSKLTRLEVIIPLATNLLSSTSDKLLKWMIAQYLQYCIDIKVPEFTKSKELYSYRYEVLEDIVNTMSCHVHPDFCDSLVSMADKEAALEQLEKITHTLEEFTLSPVGERIRQWATQGLCVLANVSLDSPFTCKLLFAIDFTHYED